MLQPGQNSFLLWKMVCCVPAVDDAYLMAIQLHLVIQVIIIRLAHFFTSHALRDTRSPRSFHHFFPLFAFFSAKYFSTSLRTFFVGMRATMVSAQLWS